jgi:hypothetical protein
LADALADEGLAVVHREGHEVWMGMHPRLAGVYMSALAEELAAGNALHPTTDETLDHVAATGWSLPRLAAVLLDDPALAESAHVDDDDASRATGDPERRASLALLCIQTVVPTDLDALPIDTIAKIRQRYGPELFRFQDFVDDVARSPAARRGRGPRYRGGPSRRRLPPRRRAASP